MNKEEFENIYHHDQNHWWYQSLQSFFCSEILKYKKGNIKVLDIGAGPGGIGYYLKSHPTVSYFAIDPSDEALNFLKKRNLNSSKGDFSHYGSFENEKFDIIISTDSLYFLKTDEAIKDALSRISNHLNPQGLFLCHVPAFSCLSGAHDKQVHIERRFTKSDLNLFVDQKKFSILFKNYRYCGIAPLVLLVRKFFQSNDIKSDIKDSSKMINKILCSYIKFEDKALPSFMKNIFGSSLAFGLIKK